MTKQVTAFLSSNKGKALTTVLTAGYFIIAIYAQQQRLKLIDIQIRKEKENG